MILRIATLTGASAGVCSVVYFLGLVCRVNPFISLLVSALMCAAMVRWLRPAVSGVPSEPPSRLVLIAFLVVLVGALATFVFTARKEPHGYWDAWSLWNLHARFLERGGAHWKDLFTTQIAWTHADYPLLVPSIIAQIWAVLQSETTAIPIAIAFIFTFGAVAMLMGTVRALRGWDQALIAGALLLGTATFLLQGAAQYADLPLAFFMIAALALLCFEDRNSTVLAGAMAGFAAWTKNEGLLFVVALVLARCITRLRHRGAAKLAGELKWFAAGLVPVLAVVALFKFGYAPPGDLFSQKITDVLARLFDFGRWVTAIQGFVTHAFVFGSLPTFIVPGILILAAYAFLVRFKIDPERRTGIATIVTAVILTLAGDFAVYLLLSNDLNWQVNTSLDRILMQIWPATLLGFFLAAAKPQLAAAPPPQKDPKKSAKKAAATRRRS